VQKFCANFVQKFCANFVQKFCANFVQKFCANFVQKFCANFVQKFVLRVDNGGTKTIRTRAAEGADVGRDAFGVLSAPDGEDADRGGELGGQCYDY
jgi:hypothetical protein